MTLTHSLASCKHFILSHVSLPPGNKQSSVEKWLTWTNFSEKIHLKKKAFRLIRDPSSPAFKLELITSSALHMIVTWHQLIKMDVDMLSFHFDTSKGVWVRKYHKFIFVFRLVLYCPVCNAASHDFQRYCSKRVHHNMHHSSLNPRLLSSLFPAKFAHVELDFSWLYNN